MVLWQNALYVAKEILILKYFRLLRLSRETMLQNPWLFTKKWWELIYHFSLPQIELYHFIPCHRIKAISQCIIEVLWQLNFSSLLTLRYPPYIKVSVTLRILYNPQFRSTMAWSVHFHVLVAQRMSRRYLISVQELANIFPEIVETAAWLFILIAMLGLWIVNAVQQLSFPVM